MKNELYYFKNHRIIVDRNKLETYPLGITGCISSRLTGNISKLRNK